MKANRKFIALNALLAALLACNLPAAQRPVQAPDLAGTITAQAVALYQSDSTPAASLAPAVTDTPSATPTITLTATSTVPQVTVSSATNCRTGPGVEYDLLYTLQPGQMAQVIGKDLPDNYWIINMPSGGTCWLWGQYASLTGNTAALPDFAPPPTPTASVPAAPTNFHVGYSCHLVNTPFLLNKVHVDLSWQDNATNEEGYYVYRDGALLATLGANETSFSDDTTMVAVIKVGSTPPRIAYSVQAFNASGKSKKVVKSISCWD